MTVSLTIGAQFCDWCGSDMGLVDGRKVFCSDSCRWARHDFRRGKRKKELPVRSRPIQVWVRLELAVPTDLYEAVAVAASQRGMQIAKYVRVIMAEAVVENDKCKDGLTNA